MLVSPLTFEQSAPASRAALEQAQRAYGRVPNLLASAAHSPITLHSYLQLTSNLQRSSLSDAERERIALAVSALNGCEYCLVAHSWLAQRAKLAAAEVRQAIHAPHEHPLTSLAVRLVNSHGALSEAQLSEARQAGIDNAKVFEVVACVVWMHFSNYLGNLISPEIDFPRADML